MEVLLHHDPVNCCRLSPMTLFKIGKHFYWFTWFGGDGPSDEYRLFWIEEPIRLQDIIEGFRHGGKRKLVLIEPGPVDLTCHEVS